MSGRGRRTALSPTDCHKAPVLDANGLVFGRPVAPGNYWASGTSGTVPAHRLPAAAVASPHLGKPPVKWRKSAMTLRVSLPHRSDTQHGPPRVHLGGRGEASGEFPLRMALWADVCENIPERGLKGINAGFSILATHGDPSRRLRRWYAPDPVGCVPALPSLTWRKEYCRPRHR